MKKLSLYFLCMMFVLMRLLSGCTGSPIYSQPSSMDKKPEIESNNMLYGMCYIGAERDNVEDFAAKDVLLMNNLGVGAVRNWMHITDLLINKNKINPEACRKMHRILAYQKKYNMKIIGMSHTNFNKGTNKGGKPRRDISSESYYVKWLVDYYTSWKTLVAEFPEVEYWEIDNEVNNADFMKNINGETVYTIEEMADISADMHYFASRAIHKENPKAKTVLGGITEPLGLGHGENIQFLECMYKCITSGNFGYFYGIENKALATKDPDDYFEIACWHPYVWDTFNKKFFIEKNNEIYDVILRYEPEGKDVFFTETGFSNENKSEEITAKAVTDLFKAVSADLPYVKVVTYFKLFDVAKKTWTGKFSRYGLFYDPHGRSYTQAGDDPGNFLINGAPKFSAYAFQKAAGGVGRLDILLGN